MQWLPPLRLQFWLNPPPASMSPPARRRLEQAHRRRRVVTGAAAVGVLTVLVGGSVPTVAAGSTVARGSVEQPGALALGAGSAPQLVVPRYAMVASGANKNGLLLPGQSLATPSFPISPVTRLGIPAVALDAYQRAATAMVSADPGCRISWTLIAGIGRVESDHGQYGGRTPAVDGSVAPAILGIELDGRPGVALIRDSDGGRLDGDTVYDRAVGPMQFIPGTWAAFDDADGDGNGVSDPHNLYDAALATASYLCSGPGDLSRPGDAGAAVYRYNQSQAYVDTVLAYAAAYATGVTPVGPAPRPDTDTPVVEVPTTPPAPDPTTGPPTPGAPTGTTPPTTGPPTTGPPTSEPPTSGPPTSGPPTSEPPTSEPPTTSVPPTTDPGSEPPSSESPPTTDPGGGSTEPPDASPTSPGSEAPTSEPPDSEVPTAPGSEAPTSDPAEGSGS